MQYIILPIIGVILALILFGVEGELQLIVAAITGGIIGWFASVVREAGKLQKRFTQQTIEIQSLLRRVYELEKYKELASREDHKKQTQSQDQGQAKPDSDEAELETSVADVNQQWKSKNKVKTTVGAGSQRKTDPLNEWTTRTHSLPKETDTGTSSSYQEAKSPPPKRNLFIQITDWLKTGNVPVKVGVILSFIGVSFLLKWAVDRNLIFFPIELRLGLVSIFGIMLLGIGWRLRQSMRIYALSLQGGGAGVLYLTIFASYRIFNVLSVTNALILLVVLTVITGILALLQNALVIAMLGMIGGFLAPVLTIIKTGDPVEIFGYYLILNGGVFVLAWLRNWRALNLLGFFFTYGISWYWASQFYTQEHLKSVLPFVVAHYLLYFGIPIIFSRRQKISLKDYIDGTLVFGTPVVTFAMLSGLLKHTEYGLAISSVLTSVLYLTTAWILITQWRSKQYLLSEAFIGLGVTYATLAIPLAFGARLTSALWAIQGAGLIWVGIRQSKLLARVAGSLLIFGSGLAFLRNLNVPEGLPIFNSFMMGTVIISIAALFGSYLFYKQRNQLGWIDQVASLALLCWGVIWWTSGGLLEISNHMSPQYKYSMAVLLIAASSSLGVWVSRKLNWPNISWPMFVALPVLFIASLVATEFHKHPFENLGYIAWSLAICFLVLALKGMETWYQRSIGWLHACLLWILSVLLYSEVVYIVGKLTTNGSWKVLAVVVCLTGITSIVTVLKNRWPIAAYQNEYIALGIGSMLMIAAIWVMTLNLTPGNSAPLPYMPLLNPLDLASLFMLGTLGFWFRQFKDELNWSEIKVYWTSVMSILCFLFATGVVVRTVHHWTGVPFKFSDLFDSVILQASLSLFWGVTSLAVMIIAAKRVQRTEWFVGATLMGIVVLKLLAIDLSNTGTLSRVFSFLGVGLLLLIVGYFAGVPPRDGQS